MQPRHHDLVDVLGRDAGVVEGHLPRLLAERGRSACSPKRSSHCFERGSPGVRHRSRNSSVTEAPPRCSASTGASSCRRRRAARRRRRRPRARRRSPAGRCGVGRPRPARARTRQRGAQRADARADRARAVERGRVAIEAQRGVDDGGVGLVEVGRRRGREPRRCEAACGRRSPSGAAPAGRLDAHGRGVLVVGGDRAGALAGVGAGRLADGAALQPVVRHVAGESQDPSHRRQSRSPNLTVRQGTGRHTRWRGRAPEGRVP